MIHPFKLAPIELSVLRVLESSKKGHTLQSICESIKYAIPKPGLYAHILERFTLFNLAREKDGLYFRNWRKHDR